MTTGAFTIMLGVFHGLYITPTLVFLQAASAACILPVAFTVVPLIFPSSLRSLAVALVLLVGQFIGAGAVPPGIGLLAEKVSFSFSFSFLGVLLLGILPLLFHVIVVDEQDLKSSAT
jgi:MFS family permease